MIRCWHFYRLTDGVFTPSRLCTSDPALAVANTPPGCAAWGGEVDPESQRVDLATGGLVDWQPPQPSRAHVWDRTTRRWALTPEAAQREADRINARRRIEALELAQRRPLRELALDASNQAALARLQQIETEIATLRPAVARGSLTR